MTRRVLGSLSLALGVALLLAQSLVGPLSASHTQPLSASTAAPTSQHAALGSQYGQLPLAFELNEGQAGASARFLAHGSGYTLALTPSEALLALTHDTAASSLRSRLMLPGQPKFTPPQPATSPTLLGMQWLGANQHPIVTGEQPLPGTVNYFLGNDPAKWHTNIPTYQQVRLHDVYPGVDLVYYGNQGQLEYDFVVAPGANPAAIQLGFSGAQRLGVDLAGNLSLTLPGGALQQGKPLAYQTVNGARQTVAGGYTLAGSGHVSFALGAYNPRLPLVIDPAYKFSTYLGGSGHDFGTGIALDASGNAYIAGNTDSPDFPTLNPIQASNAGGMSDIFVCEFNAAGTALIYSTYLGGSNNDQATGIAVDSSGQAHVTGYTFSTNYPTTAGALEPTNPDTSVDPVVAFVSKLSASGSMLMYSTYLTGTRDSSGYGIAVNASDSAYVTGSTNSLDFPTTAGALQRTNLVGMYTGFVTQLNSSGGALVYSTYLGGSTCTSQGSAITLDSSGDAFVTGGTCATDFPVTPGAFQTTNHTTNIDGGNTFVSKFNSSGSALIYSTYLGGSNIDGAVSIAVDTSGDAVVTGTSYSTDFPTKNPLQATNYDSTYGNAFVSKFNATGTALIYSTYLGGTGVGDNGYSVTVDGGGNAYLTGFTSSPDFPTANPLQATMGGIAGNAFVSVLSATGTTLIYSSFLGGHCQDDGYGIAVGADDTVYVTGLACSSNFPTVNAYQPTNHGLYNIFLTKLTILPSVDTTTGVFRPSNGALYLKNANTTGPADITLNYGLPGDQPITGDWTGKGYKSIGIYRNGTFYLRNSNTTGYADIVVPFGTSTDIPVAGDWTGKGYDSIGVYRPSTNTFLLRNSNTSGPPDITARLGISGDVPIVGDWTGKGWDSVGVFRPSNGITYLRNSNTTGFANIAFTYGIAGDKPVVGDWTAQGKDTIGVDRGGNFLLRNSNSTGPANLSFYLGVNGDDPIAGPWLATVGGTPPPVHRKPSAPSSHAATTPSRRLARQR